MTIVRDIIRVKSVRSHAEGDDVGYIRITQFNEQTTDGLKQAINDLNSQLGADKIKGYIVDLRNNPGGLLDQAISVSDTFLDKGEIVSTRGRNPEETQRFNARPGDMTKGKPLIVLINGGSASASEIVAGALAGPQARDTHWHAFVRQGIGADHHPARRRQWRAAADHGALLHAVGPLHPGAGHQARYRGDCRTCRTSLKGETDSEGEASLRGHLAATGAEKSGSQSYVPPDEKDDKALHMALDLLRGTASNTAFPPNPKAAVPN